MHYSTSNSISHSCLDELLLDELLEDLLCELEELESLVSEHEELLDLLRDLNCSLAAVKRFSTRT